MTTKNAARDAKEAPPPYAEVGALLRAAREKLELTQAQMAVRLEWTQAQISKLESGESLPRTEDVRKVAGLYKLKPEQLLPKAVVA